METRKYYQGVDALKFIAVIAIVLFHYADHGLTDLRTADLSYNWLILGFLKLGGYWKLSVHYDYGISFC